MHYIHIESSRYCTSFRAVYGARSASGKFPEAMDMRSVSVAAPVTAEMRFPERHLKVIKTITLVQIIFSLLNAV